MNDFSRPDGFVSVSEVIPDVLLDVRYYSTYNFVGERVNGYEAPVVLLTKEAAAALSLVNADMRRKGLRLVLYDGYRPQRAVDHFVRWAKDPDDIKTKDEFYPELDKSELFPKGYIAVYSGHSRGLTVDLTLTDSEGKEIDMGGEFDWFSKISSHDYENLTETQKANRRLLREGMLAAGFDDYAEEWWHYTFICDAPKVYYDFPIE